MVYSGTIRIRGRKKYEEFSIPVITDNLHALDAKHLDAMEEKLRNAGFVLLLDNREDNRYIQQLYVNTEKFKEIEICLERTEKYE